MRRAGHLRALAGYTNNKYYNTDGMPARSHSDNATHCYCNVPIPILAVTPCPSADRPTNRPTDDASSLRKVLLQFWENWESRDIYYCCHCFYCYYTYMLTYSLGQTNLLSVNTLLFSVLPCTLTHTSTIIIECILYRILQVHYLHMKDSC